MLIDLLEAAKGLKRIVEEIDGTMNHGTWRDDKGTRLKDTPEWVAIYLAISDVDSLLSAYAVTNHNRRYTRSHGE